MAEQLSDRMDFVFAFVKGVPNTGIDEDFEAMNTRRMCDIDVGIANRVAVAGRLRDRVYFSVNSAVTVLFDFTVGCA
jgi:hypothetical protein